MRLLNVVEKLFLACHNERVLMNKSLISILSTPVCVPEFRSNDNCFFTVLD